MAAPGFRSSIRTHSEGQGSRNFLQRFFGPHNSQKTAFGAEPVVEINHAVYRRLAPDGFPGIWGDVTGDEILKAAHIDTARVLLLAVPDQTTVQLTCTAPEASTQTSL